MTVSMKCRDCGEVPGTCDRCETDSTCACCPCECEYVDPSPKARESMKRYDRAAERRERADELPEQE